MTHINKREYTSHRQTTHSPAPNNPLLMKKLILPLSLAAGFAINLAGAEPNTAPPSRESIE
jgi:hypothetical protein